MMNGGVNLNDVESSGYTGYDLVRLWHTKKNDPSDTAYTGRPTVINMSLGPVLSEVVFFSNSYMEDNPSVNMGIWRTSLNDAMKFYAASTFIICLGLVTWLFVTSIRKEWKTFYR